MLLCRRGINAAEHHQCPRASACDCHAQSVRTPQETYLDGPSSWDEVDTEELERIAVNILRSVVPSTENLEVGARLAMQVGMLCCSALQICHRWLFDFPSRLALLVHWHLCCQKGTVTNSDPQDRSLPALVW